MGVQAIEEELSITIITANKIAQEKRSDKKNGERKKGANKMANFCEVGERKNERQMENNVNCEEMRFVIRNLVDVDDVSPAMVPEIRTLTGDYLDVIFPGNGARNSF